MNNLPTLLGHFNELEEAIVASDGELTPELEKRLTELEVDIGRKADQLAFVIERCPAIAEIYRQQAMKYTKLARFFEATEERLKEHVSFSLQAAGEESLVGMEFEFRLLKQRASVVITDPANLPKDYVEMVIKPDKKAIKGALERGESLEGAELSFKRPLQIRLRRKELK